MLCTATPVSLILDEPTSSLALNEIDNLFAHLEDLRSKGMTCVFITHKLAEIFKITDYTTVLRDGEVTGEYDRNAYREIRHYFSHGWATHRKSLPNA